MDVSEDEARVRDSLTVLLQVSYECHLAQGNLSRAGPQGENRHYVMTVGN